jgi:hypothetical protein
MIPAPQVRVDGKIVDTSGIERPPVDLLAMAQDRRWQDIDTIRTIKSVAGTGLIVGGLAAGAYGAHQDRDDIALAGLAAAGAGLLLKASSQVDIRQWEMLPRTVFLLPLRVEPGTHDITINFPNARRLHQSWRDIIVPPTGEATYYFRMQRWTSGEHTWPPPALTGELPTGARPE